MLMASGGVIPAVHSQKPLVSENIVSIKQRQTQIVMGNFRRFTARNWELVSRATHHEPILQFSKLRQYGANQRFGVGLRQRR
jgi:hypothetical protein